MMIDSIPMLIDTVAHIRNRDRAAPMFEQYGFLKKTVAEKLVERLDVVRREFPLVADIGCHTGVLAKLLMQHSKIGRVIALDPSPAMTKEASKNGCDATAAPYDALPFADNSLDGVFSAFALHWVNDLPALLGGIHRLLKPDGLMIISVPGGDSFGDLRAALADAETSVSGGMSARVMPMADIRTLGSLLGRGGFALPVADNDTINVTWPDAFALMRDLRGMGEANALSGRSRNFTPREVLMRTAEIMNTRFAGADGRIEMKIEIVTLTGWAPHESQQKPLKPGSGSVDLAAALNPKNLREKDSK